MTSKTQMAGIEPVTNSAGYTSKLSCRHGSYGRKVERRGRKVKYGLAYTYCFTTL